MRPFLFNYLKTNNVGRASHHYGQKGKGGAVLITLEQKLFNIT
jgi:hypothetical protein